MAKPDFRKSDLKDFITEAFADHEQALTDLIVNAIMNATDKERAQCEGRAKRAGASEEILKAIREG